MMRFVFFLVGILAVYHAPGWITPLAWATDPSTEIEINVRDGMLSVNVNNAPLAEILIQIAKETGFKLVLYGGLESTITQTFSDAPMTEGIRRIVGNHSVAIMHRIVDGPDDRKILEDISEVWVFDTGGSKGKKVIAASEPEEINSDIRTDLSEDTTIPDEKPSPSPYIRKKNILSRPQFEEDTEVGHWAGILFNSPDRSLRERAITELQRIGSDDAVTAIATVLGEDDIRLRRHAVESLGSVINERARPLLGQALIGDKNPSVRLEAVRFFASQRNEVSRAFLTTALKDDDEEVRALAKQALTAY